MFNWNGTHIFFSSIFYPVNHEENVTPWGHTDVLDSERELSVDQLNNASLTDETERLNYPTQCTEGVYEMPLHHNELIQEIDTDESSELSNHSDLIQDTHSHSSIHSPSVSSGASSEYSMTSSDCPGLVLIINNKEFDQCTEISRRDWSDGDAGKWLELTMLNIV